MTEAQAKRMAKLAEEHANKYCGNANEYVRIAAGLDFKVGFQAAMKEMETCAEAMKEREAKLRDALMFYADMGSYCTFHPYNENNPKTFSPVIQDEGKIAKKALAESEGEK